MDIKFSQVDNAFPYRIIKKIAEGHFGKVYECCDKNDERFAMKVLQIIHDNGGGIDSMSR